MSDISNLRKKNELIEKLLKEYWINEQSRGQLYEITYDELIKRAQSLLAKELNTNSVHPEDLISESFLRVFSGVKVPWNGKTQFYAFTYVAMKRVLIDHGRKKRATKRKKPPTGQIREDDAATPDVVDDAIAWLDFLEQLAKKDATMSLILGMFRVEGFSFAEIANQLNSQNLCDLDGKLFTADTVEGYVDLGRRMIRKNLRKQGDAG